MTDAMNAVSLPNEQHSVGVRLATDEEKQGVILVDWSHYEQSMPPYQATHGLGRYDWVRTCAEKALSKGLTYVATVEGYDDVVLGWACAEPPYVLHYVYVKRACRRRHIGAMLIAACGITGGERITHRPRKELRAYAAKWRWQYKPMTKEEVLG